MEMLVLYVWLKLDAVRAAMAVLGFGAAIVLIVMTIVGLTEGMKFKELPGFVGVTVVASIALPLLLLLPSQKDAAILFGAHYAIKAAESPEGQKVVTLLRKRVNEYLDQALNEPEKK